MIGQNFSPMPENMRYYCASFGWSDDWIKLGLATISEWAGLETE
jgi:hypothetical protein